MGIVYLLTKSVILDSAVSIIVLEGFLFWRMFNSGDISYLIPIFGIPLFFVGLMGMVIHSKYGNDNEEKKD